MARARARPLVATYCMKEKATGLKSGIPHAAVAYWNLTVWSSHRSRCTSCREGLDLLLTISRSIGKTCGTVADAFLDYALLLGKPPSSPFFLLIRFRLKPLLSIDPNDISTAHSRLPHAILARRLLNNNNATERVDDKATANCRSHHHAEGARRSTLPEIQLRAAPRNAITPVVRKTWAHSKTISLPVDLGHR